MALCQGLAKLVSDSQVFHNLIFRAAAHISSPFTFEPFCGDWQPIKPLWSIVLWSWVEYLLAINSASHWYLST